MKSIKKLVLALTLIVGVSSFTYAQSKVAHINTQQLLSEMPEMQTIQAELQKLEQTYSADIQASVKELQEKTQAIQNEINGLTDAEIEARKAEFDKTAQDLEKMDANITEYRRVAMEDLQKKRQEKLTPVYKKINDAIQKVAAAQGYDYVLDSTQGGGVIVANGKDLIDDVKKELGIQ